jgi:hypothetical protein
MAYRKHKLLSLIEADPRAAAEQIAEAFREAKCSRKDTAIRLELAYNTLTRYVTALDRALATREQRKPLTKRLEKIKASAIREGWHHEQNKQGGRPAEA